MEFLTTTLLMLSAFVTGLFGVQVVESPQTSSVEVGLEEMSPRGPEGGYAIPASGCSPADPNWHGYPIHDCSVYPGMSSDQSIIRFGDSVTISWNPYTHQNCVLSNNLMNLSPTPDGNVADSRTLTLTGETTFTITCDGAGNENAVTVKVLPKTQES